MAPFFRLASIVAAALLSATLIQASAIPAPVLTPQSSNPGLAKDEHFEILEKRGGVITSCRVPGTIALTFDDGPFAYTNRLLDILKDRGVKATFFVNGHNIGDIYHYDWVVKRAYREGHQIASHTWSHADLTSLSYNQINTQMVQLDNALKSIIGVRPIYMRPPFGNLNSAVTEYLDDHGYKIVKWRVDTNDWAHPHNIDASLNAYRRAGGSGFIVLQHDTFESTVNDLVPRAIDYAKGRGWELVTVGECLGVSQDNWYRS
ncbi:MAG: carbohydrate esterase family 4 protein [Linnemannia gamsii]|nr:MAG: carbohydrate esterase family 4 protein [Linnemannia gamsii]